jgi:mono/diheme cytochrome c family protein
MKKLFKWIGIILASLVALVLVLVAFVLIDSNSRMNKVYNIQAETVVVPTDAASIEYGKHVATIHGCVDCHAPDLGGRLFIKDPMVGEIYSANLTSGAGGIGGVFSDADFVRAIRHGVDEEGKPLLIMPANELYYLSDKDLGAVIAYVKSVPPVDHIWPEPKVAFPIRLLAVAGQFKPFPVEEIDHTAPRPVSPEVGVTVEYGKYLAVTCTGCHGEGLSGGPIPGFPPDFPPALNITPGGELVGWSEADFIQTLRTGVTPSGTQLRNQYMPWQILGQMTDPELQALWLYLQSVPAKEYGNH